MSGESGLTCCAERGLISQGMKEDTLKRNVAKPQQNSKGPPEWDKQELWDVCRAAETKLCTEENCCWPS